MNLEQLGVEVLNPEQVIEIEGGSFAEFCLILHTHAANLELAAHVLELENPGGANSRLLSSQQALVNLAGAIHGALHEHLRLAREQGLQFALVGERRKKH